MKLWLAATRSGHAWSRRCRSFESDRIRADWIRSDRIGVEDGWCDGMATETDGVMTLPSMHKQGCRLGTLQHIIRPYRYPGPDMSWRIRYSCCCCCYVVVGGLLSVRPSLICIHPGSNFICRAGCSFQQIAERYSVYVVLRSCLL